MCKRLRYKRNSYDFPSKFCVGKKHPPSTNDIPATALTAATRAISNGTRVIWLRLHSLYIAMLIGNVSFPISLLSIHRACCLCAACLCGCLPACVHVCVCVLYVYCVLCITEVLSETVVVFFSGFSQYFDWCAIPVSPSHHGISSISTPLCGSVSARRLCQCVTRISESFS